MNKKGAQGMTGGMVGGLVLVALTLIVGVILLQASAQNVGQVRDLVTQGNATLGTMTNGTTIYITAYKSCSSFKIWNATEDVEIPSTNYTVTNNVIYNGQEAISVAPGVETLTYAYNKGTAKYQGICQPLTYDPTSGGRAVAFIIIIMFAVALAVVALSPTLRSGVMDALGM